MFRARYSETQYAKRSHFSNLCQYAAGKRSMNGSNYPEQAAIYAIDNNTYTMEVSAYISFTLVLYMK